jgi:hypothetical protein
MIDIKTLRCKKCNRTGHIGCCSNCGHGRYEFRVSDTSGSVVLVCAKCFRQIYSYKCEKCGANNSITDDDLLAVREQGGCFIATAVYGDYDFPEVLILRRYRDDRLESILLGRLFIQFYYLISPSVSKIVSKNEFLKDKIRNLILDPLTKKLKK